MTGEPPGVDIYTDEPRPEADGQQAAHDGPEASGSRSGRAPSQATRLRELALARYRLGVTPDGTPFAVPTTGPQVVRAFRSGRTGLRAELARAYAREHGAVPSAGALADALTALEGEAAEADPEPLALRVAEHDGGLVLDLGRPDGHAVTVTAHGWRIVERPPVLFRRTALTAGLPDPVRGGSLRPLRDRLNVTDADWPLALGWLVAALFPDIPHPALALLGEQGTGKSTATGLLVGVLDPSPVPLRSAPDGVEQWAVAASASWTVGLDNLSGLPAWLSDALCRAATGDGLVRRALYSDGDVAVLSFRRCVVLNGIDLGGVRGDLADRLLAVELRRIEQTERRTAAEVDLTAADRAAVLGALLDLTCEVLAVLPAVNLATMPRMADFARILAAVDKVTGSTGLDRYTRQAGDLAAAVLDADPFAAAVRHLMDGITTGSWEGTGGALLELLAVPEPRPRSWPADAQRANAALRRIAPALRAAAGLAVSDRKHYRTRQTVWALTRVESEDHGTDAASPDH